jgi:hypothetical protein
MSEVIAIDRREFAAALKAADGNLKKVSVPPALSNRRSVEEWEATVRADIDHAIEGIRRTVEGWVAAGRHLQQAKDELDHGEFGPMLERLKLHAKTAERYMTIARNPILSNPTHGSHLPTSLRTLSELATLPADFLKAKISDGTITRETTRKDVEALKATLKGQAQYRSKRRATQSARSELEQRVAELEAELEEARQTTRNRERELEAARQATRNRERELSSEIETLRARVAELESRGTLQPRSARISASQIVDLTEADIRRRKEEMNLLESLGQMTLGPWRKMSRGRRRRRA